MLSAETDLQWRNLSFVKWQGGIDFAHFWCGVLKCSDASVTNRLRELTLFAVSWLARPW